MFFARPKEYPAAELFSFGHMVLLAITVVLVIVSAKNTRHKSNIEVKKIIRNSVIFLWILEVIKIIFNLCVGNAKNPNTYIPLYFCSIILYAGMFSAFGKGKIKKVGDVFIATGGFVAGICFILYPNTSLTNYPAFHYISIQSFIFHGIMIYLGILVNITDYIKIEKKDIIYYFSFVTIMSAIAYGFNSYFDSNLMFISKNYPNTPVEIIYDMSGKLFPLVMTIGQATVPFYCIYVLKKEGKEVRVLLEAPKLEEIEN